MTSTINGQISKTDRRGRVWTPKQRQEELLDEFERSGLSGPKFAALVGVKYGTFANWVQRRKKRRAAEGKEQPKEVITGSSVRLLEAAVDLEASSIGGVRVGSAVLVVELPGGGRARLESPTQIRLAAHLLISLEQTLSLPC